MSLTTDPNDPRLGRGVDAAPGPQHDTYLVLSVSERDKGFVRPLRRSYKHVGPAGPIHPVRVLNDEELERYAQFGYAAFEAYPAGSAECVGGLTGRYWTKSQLAKINTGCGTVTTMGLALCETYARDPTFYGSTYCCGCQMHLAINEFVWTEDGARVGT